MKALRFALPLFLLSLSALGQSEHGKLAVAGSPGPTVLLECAEWHPKPKGCEVTGGSLDDVVEALLKQEARNGKYIQVQEARFDQCYTALDNAIKGIDKILKNSKRSTK